jgi:hypothetical protein
MPLVQVRSSGQHALGGCCSSTEQDPRGERAGAPISLYVFAEYMAEHIIGEYKAKLGRILVTGSKLGSLHIIRLVPAATDEMSLPGSVRPNSSFLAIRSAEKWR